MKFQGGPPLKYGLDYDLSILDVIRFNIGNIRSRLSNANV